MSDFSEVSWDKDGLNGGGGFKPLIIIILIIVLFLLYRVGAFDKVISMIPNNSSSSVYTVEVNRRANYNTQIKKIVKQLCPTNDSNLRKAQVLHDFVVKYLEYDYSALTNINNTKLIHANEAETCFLTRKAVCGGYAALYKDLCNEAGIKCEFVTGKANMFDNSNLGHAWNAVYLDGKCYHVDVCWDDTGGSEYEFFMRGTNYINVNTDTFRSWDGNFPFEKSGISRRKIKDITLQLTVK